MLEFANRSRGTASATQWEDLNLGGRYAAAKASRFPAFEAPRAHGSAVKEASILPPLPKPSATTCKLDVKRWSDQVSELLASPPEEAPRRTSLAEKSYRVAELLREAGKYADARQAEAEAYSAARDMWIRRQCVDALKKARNPVTRWSETGD